MSDPSPSSLRTGRSAPYVVQVYTLRGASLPISLQHLDEVDPGFLLAHETQGVGCPSTTTPAAIDSTETCRLIFQSSDAAVSVTHPQRRDEGPVGAEKPPR